MIKSSTLMLGAGLLAVSLVAPLTARAEHKEGSLSVLIGSAVGQVLAHDAGYRVRDDRRHHDRRWQRDHKDFHRSWERAHRRFHGHAERDCRHHRHKASRDRGRKFGWDRGRGHGHGWSHGHRGRG